MKILITESQFRYLFEAATLSDIHDKYYSKIPEDIFKKIISADPTYRIEKSEKIGKYGKWLLSLYMNRQLKIEDLYKATEYLQYFIKYYNVIQVKDINKYKSLQDLYNVVSQYMNNDNIATSKGDEVRKIKEGAEKVYEDSEWLVIVPHTKEASCYYGKGTQWCTAAEHSNNMFNYYNNKGPLYINIDKVNGKKYQFNFETDSFMDEKDQPIEGKVAESCGLSDGLCNWYRENVEASNKLFEKWIDFFYIEESGNEYAMIQDEENETLYRLYDKTNNKNICGGLIYDDDSMKTMRKWYLTLYNKGYCIIPNTKGLYTLIVTDSYDLDEIINNAVEISLLEGDYIHESDNILLFDVTYDNGRRCILQNNGIHQYQCKDGSLINNIDFLDFDNIIIYKKDGSCDILNWNHEEIFDNLKGIERDGEDDDIIYAYNEYGQRVKIDLYVCEEEIIEDEE